MYYQQNGSYMQDLNYYNQNPNYMYNPYMQGNQNGVYHTTQNGMGMNDVNSMNGIMNTQMPRMPQNQQNLNAMYPAVYRIISPVVSQVVANNNTNYLTEETLNSMVDTVFNIVEGDIPMTDEESTRQVATNENTSSSNCTRETPTGTRR